MKQTPTNTLNIRNKLIGSMEIALFMPSAANRFKGDTKAMIRSFTIPVMLLPMTIAAVMFISPNAADFGTGTTAVMTAIYSLRLFVYLAAFFAFGYMVAKTLDKTEEFTNFVTANNWLSVPMSALMLIPVLMAASGNFAWENSYTLVVMITLYSFACTAFMATRIMRIPYEMSAFLAITGLVIHHNALDFVKWAAVNTINLLA